MRWKLTIEYDGGPFQGWQRQDNGPSVQAAVEQAILKLTGESVTITAAGRTDTGVHALGQVAHADIAKELAPDKMRDALNAHLRPHPIAVLSAEIASEDFHARFNASRILSGASSFAMSACATCPSACTPVSVRPAAVIVTPSPVSFRIACSTAACTDGPLSCRCHPWKGPPSYSMVSFQRIR
jgi:tRNA pseudouridine(38-40) synthase